MQAGLYGNTWRILWPASLYACLNLKKQQKAILLQEHVRKTSTFLKKVCRKGCRKGYSARRFGCFTHDVALLSFRFLCVLCWRIVILLSDCMREWDVFTLNGVSKGRREETGSLSTKICEWKKKQTLTWLTEWKESHSDAKVTHAARILSSMKKDKTRRETRLEKEITFLEEASLIDSSC